MSKKAQPKTSRKYLLFRMWFTVFIIVCIIRLFWNTVSGFNMFPLNVAFGVSVMLTGLFTVMGLIVVGGGTNFLHRNDPEFQRWKKNGGRAYWDTLGWPIGTASPIERQTGLAEPKYKKFVPPANWQYQCPVCGSRVEKAVDVCWNCNYGADGDSTAYRKRWGNPPKTCSGPSCKVETKATVPQPKEIPPDWRPVG